MEFFTLHAGKHSYQMRTLAKFKASPTFVNQSSCLPKDEVKNKQVSRFFIMINAFFQTTCASKFCSQEFPI